LPTLPESGFTGKIFLQNSNARGATSVCRRCWKRYIETMMRVGKIAVCLAGWLALNAGLCAAGLASINDSTNNPLPDNPYAAIVIRNIFGLVSPPPPPDPSIDAAKNLPKITPTGIQSLFGRVKVLFKVAGAPAKQGQPAKDMFYILSQGQRQDDIEVTKIDEKNSIVTFNNHGITQELPLVSAPPSGGAPAAAPPAAGNPGPAPGVAATGNNSGPGGIIRFGGGTGGRGGGAGNGANNPGGGGGNGAPGAPGGLNFGASTQGRTYQPEASNMTADQTAIVIEAQRAVLMNSPNPPYPAALLPPTPLTRFNTPDGSTLDP